MNKLRNIDDSLLVLNDNDAKKLFLYRNDLFDDQKNKSILTCIIKFTILSEQIF